MDSNGVKFEEIQVKVDEILQETQDWTVNNEYPAIVDNDNIYLHLLAKNSSLKLLQEAKIRMAFDDQGSLGLLRLFLRRKTLT
jgi:hypothetical protein